MDERLVEIKSKDNIIFSPVYYLNGIPGAISKCYLRETVAEKIINISNNLPNGYKLKIFDAWRPIEVQKYLFENYKNKLKKDNENLSEDELNILTKQFVSLPTNDIYDAPVHCTGGAVDLTLVNKNGIELDMGTEFDDFSEKANTDYFEIDNLSFEVKNNRRLLCKIMRDAGFTSFENEWWHFDYGDKFGAKRTNNFILYHGIFNI